MKNVKSLLASKTIWGLLIALAPTLAGLFGYHLSDTFATEAQGTIDQLIQLVGLGFAAYGRIVATSQLVIKTPPSTPPPTA